MAYRDDVITDATAEYDVVEKELTAAGSRLGEAAGASTEGVMLPRTFPEPWNGRAEAWGRAGLLARECRKGQE